MPNRLLKEGIVDSSAIDGLTAQEEVFFYRLLVVSDDFGRMDARLPILKSRCFPLKDIQSATIESNLQSLVRQELINRYQIDGKPYLQILKWEQRIRSKGKYPSSDGAQPIDEYKPIDSNLLTDDGLGKGLGKGKGKGIGNGKVDDGAKAPKATRLSNDFVLSQEWIDVCKQLRPELNAQAIFDEFKDFWIAKPGQDGCKLDWLATWRNWVRRQNAPKSQFTQDKPMIKWHQTMAGVLAKGKELGIQPNIGETEGQYRERLIKAGA
jgi:hypothetical protein